jgi:hypothetical protein
METMQMTPTSILSLLESNKEQRHVFISNLMDALDNGLVEPLKVHVQLKSIEKIIDELTNTDEKKNKDGFHIAKRYKKLLQDAAEKYGEKKFQFHNSTIEIKEVGVKYNFSQCNDPEYITLSAQLEEIQKKVKAREEFLKTVPSAGMDLLVEDEVVKVYPPSKSSTTSIAVSLK